MCFNWLMSCMRSLDIKFSIHNTVCMSIFSMPVNPLPILLLMNSSPVNSAPNCQYHLHIALLSEESII